MEIFRQIAALCLTAALCVVLVGCTGTGATPQPTPSTSTTATPSPTSPGQTIEPSETPEQPERSGTPSPSTPSPSSPAPSQSPVPRTQVQNAQYVVFAWNDLGMHCINLTYDAAVLLPPYNTQWAQVIKRGNPPQVVTSGITVEYSIVNNTYSYGKRSYGQFWDNMQKIFGVTLPKDTGLNLSDPNIHNGLSGKMVVKNDHFEADGIPLTPVDDSGQWNPYQVAQITVKDSTGNIVAQTRTTAPVSDEISCNKCHGSNAFQDILQKHDNRNGTNLVSQAPVLCASCHGDPALGKPDAGPVHYLSDRIHGFHATVSPQPQCYDCHPGPVTQCSRSLAHTAPDDNCTTCHGSLAEVSSSIETGGRVPWVNEPGCVKCHSGVAQVDTGNTLYRNATGHGGVYCASCHTSPHAWVPSRVQSDNYQALQYEGAAKSIGSCGACHNTSKGGGDLREYAETHGGTRPERPNACNICHTAVTSTDTSQWPHSFQWRATAGSTTRSGAR